MSDLDEKIKSHEERLKKLKAQKQDVLARQKSKQAEQQRRDDTRKKILLGAYLLDKMREDSGAKQIVLADLDKYLTKKTDRTLFHL